MTHALPARSVRFAVLTVSDTRTAADDEGGRVAVETLAKSGHAAARRGIVRDDATAIRAWAEAALDAADVDALLVTGGTGAAPRDVTPEALLPLLEKPLPGFGEAFRRLSFDEVGVAGLLSRAEAGVARGKPVFLLPGSPKGVRLAVERLVAPLAAHLADVARSG